MMALVVAEPGSIAVEEAPDPTPDSDEVLIAVRECGICGTDLHIVRDGLATARYPLVPGHELWGEVVAVGATVDDVAAGQLVAVDPSLHCGRCAQCRRGRGNLCDHWGAVGATRPGGWAPLVAVPQLTVHVLGDDYPTDVAVLIEPVACALRGLHQLAAAPGTDALIYGAGTMGVLLALLLDLSGVGPVTLVDTRQERRALAAKVTGARVLAPEEAHGLDADAAIDASGHPLAIAAALASVRKGGTVLLFGVAPESAAVPISPFAVYQRELTIVGSMAILFTFPQAVEMVARHADAFRPVLGDRFPLAAYGDAFLALDAGRSLKVRITP